MYARLSVWTHCSSNVVMKWKVTDENYTQNFHWQNEHLLGWLVSRHMRSRIPTLLHIYRTLLVTTTPIMYLGDLRRGQRPVQWDFLQLLRGHVTPSRMHQVLLYTWTLRVLLFRNPAAQGLGINICRIGIFWLHRHDLRASRRAFLYLR